MDDDSNLTAQVFTMLLIFKLSSFFSNYICLSLSLSVLTYYLRTPWNWLCASLDKALVTYIFRSDIVLEIIESTHRSFAMFTVLRFCVVVWWGGSLECNIRWWLRGRKWSCEEVCDPCRQRDPSVGELGCNIPLCFRLCPHKFNIASMNNQLKNVLTTMVLGRQ